MKAIIMEGFGDTSILKYKEIETPNIGPDDLLVKVHACALNRCDIIQRQGIYKLPPGNSEILGIEIAGDVVKVGENVHEFKIGDRVFGYVNGGGYAEYCIQDAGFALPLPDDWTYEEGAAVAEVFQTANESIFTYGQLKSGETILINAAASGVGLAAIQLAKTVGATVIISTGTQEKIDVCMSFGADHGINYKQQDFVKEVMKITNGQGVDVILDSVGPDNLAKNIQCIKYDGRLILIGVLSGTRCEFDFLPFIDKRVMMKAHNNRARERLAQREVTKHLKERWMPFMIAGKITPVIDTVFPIEEVALAHQRMESNANIGKIILTISQK